MAPLGAPWGGPQTRELGPLPRPRPGRARPPFGARLGTIILHISRLADGIALAGTHDRQGNQYR